MSQPTFAIGIDFGTSTSLVARYQYGMASVLSDPNTRDQYQAPWTPSVVASWKDDSPGSTPEIYIGWRAWDLLESPDTIREVKRSLGDPNKTFQHFWRDVSPRRGRRADPESTSSPMRRRKSGSRLKMSCCPFRLISAARRGRLCLRRLRSSA